MRLATWNVNSLKVRLQQLLDWLASTQPDVVCLQETKLEDAKFPLAEVEAAGYRAAYSGQKTYNGVAILSREPLEQVDFGFPHDHKRVLAASTAGTRVVCVYCPNGQAVGTEKYAHKLQWFAALREWLAGEIARHPRIAVAGDFNVAPEDRDVHDPKLWAGQIMCSEPERAALKDVMGLGLQDSFRLFPQEERSFTWWDYRMLGFRRNAGLRIDHILLSAPLVAGCTACAIDKAPRRLERPSDHAPVVAEVA